jgi:hypothetical protein
LAEGGLRLRFSTAKFHLVAAATQGASLRVLVDGAALSEIEVGRPMLRALFHGEAYGKHLLTIKAEGPGLSMLNATFE